MPVMRSWCGVASSPGRMISARARSISTASGWICSVIQISGVGVMVVLSKLPARGGSGEVPRRGAAGFCIPTIPARGGHDAPNFDATLGVSSKFPWQPACAWGAVLHKKDTNVTGGPASAAAAGAAGQNHERDRNRLHRDPPQAADQPL